jgi:hypothetical protein
MKKRRVTPKAALKLAERLTNADGDEGLLLLAHRIRARLRKPMADVIAKIPGRTMVAKAEAAGVSRQNLYAWQRGAYRPTGVQAERLSKLTGIAAATITGRPDLPPPTPRRAPRAASCV